MRHSSNSTIAAGTTNTGFRNFSSPIPYLFGGLALLLALIGVALLVLACSFRKFSLSSSSSSTSTSAVNIEENKPTEMVDEKELDTDEPKIVVIMAGDSNPTYLAKPVVSATTHITQQVV